MAPLQIIILLILVRLPALLSPSVPVVEPDPSLFTIQPFTILLSFLLSQLLVVAFVFLRTRSTIRQLHETTTSAAAIASRFDNLLPLARWATILFTALHLYLPGSNLIPLITSTLHRSHFLQHIPLLAETLYIAPALLAWLAFWTFHYFVESAYRERSLPYRLASQLPTHEMPPLSAFLAMQIRHNFYLLLPILIVTLLGDLTDYAQPFLPKTATLISILVTLFVLLLLMPWLITRIWATTPLTGPLRTRLDALAHHYHLRFRNILIWKTHNAITNAAILGYLPFSRYFLMTDALLETLTDDQLEAVFAHEVGHGVHRHLWWYAAAFLSAIFLASSSSELLAPLIPTTLLQHLDPELAKLDSIALILSLLLLAPFLALAFPFIAHRFEHQADYFAIKHSPLAAGLAPRSNLSPTPTALDTTPPTPDPKPSDPRPSPSPSPSPSPNPEPFISALNAIVDLTHRSRNRRGWMHPSINHRIHFLRLIATDPLTQKRFARRMLATRLLIITFALAALALTLYAHPPFTTTP